MTRYVNSEGTLNAYNISSYEIEIGDKYGYKIIAVIYENGNWMAYRGLTNWSDKDVAEKGDRIPKEVAEYLFSTLAYNRVYDAYD